MCAIAPLDEPCLIARKTDKFTALHGFTPIAARKNLFNYIVYFSCIFGISFDQITLDPKGVSLGFLSRRLKTIGRDFIIVSFVISILKEHDYEYFDTALPPDSLDHSIADLFSWQHTANNFFVAGEADYYFSDTFFIITLLSYPFLSLLFNVTNAS